MDEQILLNHTQNDFYKSIYDKKCSSKMRLQTNYIHNLVENGYIKQFGEECISRKYNRLGD